MRRAVAAATAAFVALVVAAACGEVPTLPGSVAYISPIQLPSPTIVFGDTMRDSLGKAMPLRVFALARNGVDTIRSITVRYLLTTLNSGASLGGDGYLVAPDTLGTLRVVAQVTRANDIPLELQTAEVAIPVVPRADSIVSTRPDSTLALPLLTPLPVLVSGVGPRTRGTVEGIRVRFAIAAVYPVSVPALRQQFYLANGVNILRPDSTIALDTTKAGGVATRSLVGVAGPTGGPAADSVLVTATARSQRGAPLAGSPVRIMIRTRR